MSPGLIISAPASGTGKTTLTLGLIAAYRAQGLLVQPFKCGPDYIDPAFHAAAAGRASVNLDSWAMSADRIAALVGNADAADLIIAEGAMGLFDGVAVPGAFGTGASGDISALTGWPVILVLDVGGQAQSAAAVAAGFAAFRAAVRVAGVVLNRVASPRHEALVRRGMEEARVTVFGALPRNARVALPERHLGLVQASETSALADMLAALADFVAQHVDLSSLRAVATKAHLFTTRPGVPHLPPPGQRVALAHDAAFSFIYPHVLADWRRRGAEILPFSPLADEAPDADADVCWLAGGYPELHAGALAAAGKFRSGLRKFAETRPVHGECGGYMAMGTGLVDATGARHEMAGLLGLETSFESRKMHLGYRHARLLRPVPGFPAGAGLRGHEFHYSTILAQPDPPLAAVTDATGTAVLETGSYRGQATGSYFHMIAEDA
jgi:cobyrinic acid a,c-diamide synthase